MFKRVEKEGRRWIGPLQSEPDIWVSSSEEIESSDILTRGMELRCWKFEEEEGLFLNRAVELELGPQVRGLFSSVGELSQRTEDSQELRLDSGVVTFED